MTRCLYSRISSLGDKCFTCSVVNWVNLDLANIFQRPSTRTFSCHRFTLGKFIPPSWRPPCPPSHTPPRRPSSHCSASTPPPYPLHQRPAAFWSKSIDCALTSTHPTPQFALEILMASRSGENGSSGVFCCLWSPPRASAGHGFHLYRIHGVLMECCAVNYNFGGVWAPMFQHWRIYK